MASDWAAIEDLGSSVDSRYMPTPVTAAPAMGNGR